MEYKHFETVLEVKSDDSGDGRTIVGYASTYGNRDRDGDIVLPGAFTKSLAAKLPKMLFGHDPNQPVGVWKSYAEEAQGLILEGKLSDTPRGNEIATLIKDGAIDSLSIGFAVKDYERQDGGSTRVLKEVDLWETSIVVFPANVQAEIISIKAANEAEIERKSAEAKEQSEILASLNRLIDTLS